LAHGGPTREGAHSAHLKDVDIGSAYSLVHVLKSGCDDDVRHRSVPAASRSGIVDMVDQVGIRCAAGPSYKKRIFLS
jgi:cytosine/adenosine deaminase-related metal-dependent hydrolase